MSKRAQVPTSKFMRTLVSLSSRQVTPSTVAFLLRLEKRGKREREKSLEVYRPFVGRIGSPETCALRPMLC